MAFSSAFGGCATALQRVLQGVRPSETIHPPLKVVETQRTANGFDTPPRGWNSWGMQANPGINHSFQFNQEGVMKQADALAELLESRNVDKQDYYISLDSGWSIGDHGDEHGRLTFDPTKFDIPALSRYIHSKGLKFGVYVLPGCFCKDKDKTIIDTDIQLKETITWNDNGFARYDFDFTKEGVQQWHESVIKLFAEWGVDMIKLDFITPGSPQHNGNLPPDNSGSVIAYHKAIQAVGRPIRLNISWKLDRSPKWLDVWSANADSMRIDQDIENRNSQTFTRWATVQRAIENYRDYINRIVEASDEPKMRIFPDMDNLYVGNEESITGLTDEQRKTITWHWVGAAANLISGSDMTRLDLLGEQRLLTDPEILSMAKFTARFPMQPRNPGTGQNKAQQLQAWISGPDRKGDGRAFVVLVNYGPDLGQGGYGTKLPGLQLVRAAWKDLGLGGHYRVRDVWHRRDHETADNEVRAELGPGESQVFLLTPVVAE